MIENYVDKEAQKQLEEFREHGAKIQKAWESQRGLEQSKCPHIAGCNKLSECWDLSGRTSIVWHVLNTGETVGVCTVCQRHFRENDFDYALWRSKKNFNKLSRAVSDQPYEDKPEVRHVPEPNNLGSLSDSEIKFLFEGVRAYRKAQKDAQKALQQHFGSEVWSVR